MAAQTQTAKVEEPTTWHWLVRHDDYEGGRLSIHSFGYKPGGSSKFGPTGRVVDWHASYDEAVRARDRYIARHGGVRSEDVKWGAS